MQKNPNQLYLDVHQQPANKIQWFFLSFQHVFAMFGATVLVPILVGLPISVGLLCSGVGTLIYMVATKAKSPVYLGSSFAYIAPLQAAIALENGAGLANAGMGVMMVGLVYLVLAAIMRVAGTEWLNKILPPVVIGPVIMVIGLGLSATAVSNAMYVDGVYSLSAILIAMVTLLTTIVISVYAKGYFKLIPILIGLIVGYVFAIFMGFVDFTPVIEAPWFALPEVNIPFIHYDPFFSIEIFWLVIPVAIVTVAEHIGDHVVLGSIVNRNLLKDPGLHRTLLGDGLATFMAGFLGGPVNTTYAENTGVISMTRVASVWVIGLAAVFAIVLAFIGKISALISTIPAPVMGGISILLFGLIGLNGVRVLANNKINLLAQRNMVIIAIVLVIGLGGAVLNVGTISLSGMALSAIIGIILHQILPDKKLGYGEPQPHEVDPIEQVI
ncbi:MAG: uracil-xanthine permease family protein [Culicoidibacterales bacterium]